MTTQDLIELAGRQWLVLLGWFLAVPAATWLIGLVHGKGNGSRSPWRYLYALLVYTSCFPGMLAAVLTAYGLFIVRQNLLEANILVYFLPIVSMIITLVLIRARVSFDDVPGFDRLAGLMTLIAITFVIVLAIEKTRIWLLFGGSLTNLIGLSLGVFALLKWAAYTLLRRPDEPQVEPPSFPPRPDRQTMA